MQNVAVPGLDALPPAFQDAPSLVGLALPQPRGEPQLELKASSARRWGPAQFAPPAAVPTPAAAPAPITTTGMEELNKHLKDRSCSYLQGVANQNQLG